VVDGMEMTAASVIPDDAFDLTSYKPTHEPVTLYSRHRRIGPAQGEHETDSDERDRHIWAETLRRQLSTKRRPGSGARPALEVRCEQRHPLLRLVMSPWGLVPLTCSSEEWQREELLETPHPGPLNAGTAVQRRARVEKKHRFVNRVHGEHSKAGRPRTLSEWPEDRPFPPASCPCHAEVPFAAADVKKWLRSARRALVYPRDVV